MEDALMVEMENLFAQNKILQQDRSTRDCVLTGHFGSLRADHDLVDS